LEGNGNALLAADADGVPGAAGFGIGKIDVKDKETKRRRDQELKRPKGKEAKETGGESGKPKRAVTCEK
jgi:hypothetical protein